MSNQNILELSNLSKNYENFKLDKVSFNLKKGQIVGLIGQNGAGKSTTMKLILKIIEKDEGTIFFDGVDISSVKQHKYKEEIAYLGEFKDFFEKSKLIDISKIYKQFFASWDNEYFNELISKFNLNLNLKITELSTGMKVKFWIALCFSHYPKLLIMDEPTSGLDPLIRYEVLSLMKDYVDKYGATILLSSHIVEDLEKIANYLIFIKEGKIIEQNSLEHFISENESIEDFMKKNF